MTAIIQATPMSAPNPSPMTLAEFERVYGDRRVEVIDGIVREKPMPTMKHGKIANLVAYFITDYSLKNDSGHVMSNDSFVRISETPLRVLAPDVCFISYERLPRGPIPDGVLSVVPDLVIEVRSPSNTWSALFGKVGDYLSVGVRAVIVLDPESRTASVYRAEMVQQTFSAEVDLTVPEILPGLAIRVGRLFEG